MQPGVEQNRPLWRFLPPEINGSLARWLQANLPLKSWVLEPFGAAPWAVLEMARAGYRVLAASNNPITRFMLEMQATPPGKDEMLAVVALLAGTRKGDERLELHLRKLYATHCPTCTEKIDAQAFYWEEGRLAPSAKRLTCPYCGTAGDFPVDDRDIALAAQYAASTRLASLHRLQALQRAVGLQDPLREAVEKALDTYPPRALYAMFSLLNQVDIMQATDHQRELLRALLLVVCDSLTLLWPHPPGRSRLYQLAVPSRYCENNAWLALEAAAADWGGQRQAVPLVTWPDLPPESGGICLYRGRIQGLVRQAAKPRTGETAVSLPPIQAVAAVFPRPNQAFWVLSALWIGWLWGEKTLGKFKGVLRRQRYTWQWHTTALSAALAAAASPLAAGTPVFGLLPDAEARLVGSGFLAASRAGLVLQGAALREDERLVQAVWKAAGPVLPQTQALLPQLSETRVVQAGAQAVRELLLGRNAPVGYLAAYTAFAAGLAQNHLLPGRDEKPGAAYLALNKIARSAFSIGQGFTRFNAGAAPDVGKWWLKDPPQLDRADQVLADRVELALVKTLEAQPGQPLRDLDAALCAQFTGSLTPARSLVATCLQSYGVFREGGWFLRLEDAPARRSADLDEIAFLLLEMGAALGYEVQPGPPLTWLGPGGVAAQFFIQTTAGHSVVFQKGLLRARTFVVLPGGRANLLAFKRQDNPYLDYLMDQNLVRFVKFRLVRRLAGSPLLTQANLYEQLSLDPLTYSSPQMQLL